MSSPRSLARAALRRSTLLATLALVGCYDVARDADEPSAADKGSEGVDDKGVDEGTSPACVDDRPAVLRGLAPTWPFDGAELRQGLPRGAGYRVLAFEGSLCGSAIDRARCVRDVQRRADSLTFVRPCSAPGAIGGNCGLYIVATHREQFEFFVDRAGVLAFLGEIDTPGEALLVTLIDGHDVRCTDEAERATTARPVSDGFEVALLVNTRSCPVPIERVLLHVSRQGEVEEVGREPVIDDTPCGHP